MRNIDLIIKTTQKEFGELPYNSKLMTEAKFNETEDGITIIYNNEDASKVILNIKDNEFSVVNEKLYNIKIVVGKKVYGFYNTPYGEMHMETYGYGIERKQENNENIITINYDVGFRNKNNINTIIELRYL